jgi:hypothetical protein
MTAGLNAMDTFGAETWQRQDRFSLVPEVAGLSYHTGIYKHLAGMDPARHNDRFSHLWFWTQQNGLNEPEYVMPQVRVETCIAPFAFETRFIEAGAQAPEPHLVESLGPWAYKVEFGTRSTLGVRHNADYIYHRYRSSLLVDTASAIAGDHRSGLTVLDVACHCGVFSLQFAERGFRHVHGVDLRQENVRQAEYLRNTFGVSNVVFSQGNARDLNSLPAADVVFCGGLLYHVTFPIELLYSLWTKTREFLVLDTLTHKHPFSGFHLVCNKDVNYSAEGEFSYELHPTYRAVCDALYAVGFKVVYELVGSGAANVPNYDSGNVRSFIAAKSDRGLLPDFVERLNHRP